MNHGQQLMTAPRVSVVMGVYNGEDTLHATIESIRSQTFADWEFVIVDDASTDSSANILQTYAERDSRIRVLRQPENTGLTSALIVGCNAARGTYIARQDVGDTSLPGRFASQITFLEQNSNVVAVSSGIRKVGPVGELLGDTTRSLSPSEVTRVFLETGKAIVHAAAMVRRSSFEAAGGYRREFRVAQDIDLWLRLSETGLIAELSEVLCCISVDLRGISATSNGQQHRLAAIARACHNARTSGCDEWPLLKEAENISGEKIGVRDMPGRFDCHEGKANYFLGSELLIQRNPKCREYFTQSIRCRNQVLRSAAKFLFSYFTCTTAPADGNVDSHAIECIKGQSK